MNNTIAGRLRDFYESKRITIRIVAIGLATVVVVSLLYISDGLLTKMADEEHAKMEIWACATRAMGNDDPNEVTNLLFQIIESNRTIPVILTDVKDSIISYNNIKLPESNSQEFLQATLNRFKSGYPPIELDMGSVGRQYLYYSDSSTLRQLLIFPYVQLGVLILFLALVLWAIMTAKEAEQNKIWGGLSRETAHQLGTPISSLLAWIELLRAKDANEEILSEMEHDTERLSAIADRFQKVGGDPVLEDVNLCKLLSSAVDYMRRRISSKVKISFECEAEKEFVTVSASDSLISWVMENLIKNAVNAMKGEGSIDIKLLLHTKFACIDVTDTGCGIPRSRIRDVFRPGYSTRKNGWGLGLSLAKRIVEQYHHGRIFVRRTEVGRGTTFRILLPLPKKQ